MTGIVGDPLRGKVAGALCSSGAMQTHCLDETWEMPVVCESPTCQFFMLSCSGNDRTLLYLEA
jgi:hypothetical protein